MYSSIACQASHSSGPLVYDIACLSSRVSFSNLPSSSSHGMLLCARVGQRRAQVEDLTPHGEPVMDYSDTEKLSRDNNATEVMSKNYEQDISAVKESYYVVVRCLCI